MKGHQHYWNYPFAILDGRTRDEAAIVRYCACCVRQLAFTAKWGPIPKSYDVEDLFPQRDRRAG